jgi:predicted Zn finger-like uncharacterized protein
MYVACPSCKSLYAVSADQLRLADGQVRCGQCHTLFNATHAVFADPHQALAFEGPLHQELAREIDDLVDRALDQVSDEVGEPPAEVGMPEPELPAPDEAQAAVEPAGLSAAMDFYAQPVAGEFVHPRADEEQVYDLSETMLFHDESFHEPHTNWGGVAAALLLTVALVAQYAWWDRNRLAQVAALRPVLEWLCKPVSCDLPLRHDLTQVEMVEREVRDHPNVADALLVSAAFINRASYPQAYPVLQISFSDIAGTPVAVRRFLPEEYLHDKNPARGMAPGEQTLVMLEVVDPGERAVSYQFDFM